MKKGVIQMFFHFLRPKAPKVPLDVIRAADLGEPWAEMQLSKAFDKGLTSDEHNALRRLAYSLEATQGDPVAQYWMGFLSWTIDKNVERAICWFELAAEQGNTEAMRDLAHGYGEFLNTANLNYGPPPFGLDEKKAYYWLKKAADLGDEKAIESFRVLYGDD